VGNASIVGGLEGGAEPPRGSKPRFNFRLAILVLLAVLMRFLRQMRLLRAESKEEMGKKN